MQQELGATPKVFEITKEKNTLLSPIFGGKIYVVPPSPTFKISPRIPNLKRKVDISSNFNGLFH
jgi:hypothetical protein